MNRIVLARRPPFRSYDSFELAVEATRRHPRQQSARDSSALVAGAAITGYQCCLDSCLLNLSNGYSLDIAARDFEVRWKIKPSGTDNDGHRFGPVELEWSSGNRALLDPEECMSLLLGRRLYELVINDVGLLVYTESNPILWFGAERSLKCGSDVLRAYFE